MSRAASDELNKRIFEGVPKAILGESTLCWKRVAVHILTLRGEKLEISGLSVHSPRTFNLMVTATTVPSRIGNW